MSRGYTAGAPRHSTAGTAHLSTDRQYREQSSIKASIDTETLREAMDALRPVVTYEEACRMSDAHTARVAALRPLLKRQLLKLRNSLEREADAGWESWSAEDRAAAFREYQRVDIAIERRTKRKLNEIGMFIMDDPQRPGILAREYNLYCGSGPKAQQRRALYDLPSPLKLSAQALQK